MKTCRNEEPKGKKSKKSCRARFFGILFLGILSISFFGCGDTQYIKPPVTGKIGEILLIIELRYWKSEIGDTIRAIFERPFPMLPQHEKSYSLINVDYSSFVPVMQKHRNVITVAVSNEYPEAKVTTRHDSWATPQIVFNATGADPHEIALAISKKADFMISIIEQAELDRQSTSARVYSKPELHKTIEETFGVSMYIPDGFYLMRKAPNFLWMESQSNHRSTGLFVYDYPFTDDSTFTVKYLVNKRDKLLKQYVPGSRDSSWMTTAKYVVPELKIKKYKGLTYGELRGLWELENDYMGGPFIGRSYVDRKKGRIVAVEGYVYAPRFEKRDYVRRIEGIINTFSTGDEAEDKNHSVDSSASAENKHKNTITDSAVF
ncbi:MAG: DUF4837 family protein [Prevotellaceae bacterium]|jgi:hypothetical protein|nr:DUF4837 family protein [Prevotellaceae bacterium]